jgi:lipase
MLHVHEWGPADAPPVVCLHGITGHGRRFRKLAEERLVPRFRVLAPDLLGHGLSDWEPPWSIKAHLDAVVSTLERLGVGTARWIGHSFGGRLVMELVARDRSRVERAVLLDPAIWVPPPVALERAEDERLERAWETHEAAIEARLARGELLPHARPLLVEDYLDHLVSADDGLLRPRCTQSAVVTAFSEMAAPPPDFALLDVPTLIVRGELSNVTVDPLVELYQAGVGDLLEVVDVPGYHSPFWDAFDQTADAIDRFFLEDPRPEGARG